MESMRIINSHDIHLLSNVEYLQALIKTIVKSLTSVEIKSQK